MSIILVLVSAYSFNFLRANFLKYFGGQEIFSHQKPARKLRFTGVLLRSQYKKVIRIVSKIAKNKQAGIANERDQNFAKYQSTVKKYNNKCLGSQWKAKPTTFKRNRSQDKVEQQNRSIVYKESNAR